MSAFSMCGETPATSRNFLMTASKTSAPGSSTRLQRSKPERGAELQHTFVVCLHRWLRTGVNPRPTAVIDCSHSHRPLSRASLIVIVGNPPHRVCPLLLVWAVMFVVFQFIVVVLMMNLKQKDWTSANMANLFNNSLGLP